MKEIGDILTFLMIVGGIAFFSFLFYHYIKHRPKKERPEIYKSDLKKTWNENKTN
jgi:Trk-type K+ transport system membrane component